MRKPRSLGERPHGIGPFYHEPIGREPGHDQHHGAEVVLGLEDDPSLASHFGPRAVPGLRPVRPEINLSERRRPHHLDLGGSAGVEAGVDPAAHPLVSLGPENEYAARLGGLAVHQGGVGKVDLEGIALLAALRHTEEHAVLADGREILDSRRGLLTRPHCGGHADDDADQHPGEDGELGLGMFASDHNSSNPPNWAAIVFQSAV